MWNTSDNFKKASVGDFQTPYYTVNFFDDVISWTGADWSGTFSKQFFNLKNQKLNAGFGTSTLNGVVNSGSYLFLGSTGTIGTWISQPFTAYYPMTIEKLQTYDFIYYESDNNKVVFREGFENYEEMIRNGAKLAYNNGTVEKSTDLKHSNNLKITADGITPSGVYYDNVPLPATIFEYGEVHTSGKIGSGGTMGTFDIFTILSDTGVNIGMQVIGNGTFRNLYANYTKGASGTKYLLGTLGLNAHAHIAMTWGSNVSGKTTVGAWWGTSYFIGTTTKITTLGNFNSLKLLYAGSGCSGTFFMNDFIIKNSEETDGANYKIPTWNTVGLVDYYIRSSDDGTTWNAWHSLTGTRQYLTEDKSINSIMDGGTVSNYAQLMAVLQSTAGTNYPLQIRKLDLYASYALPDMEVLNISPIDAKLESDFIIGQIENSAINLSLSNAGGTQYFSEETNSDWRKRAIFYNRPIYLNNSIKVKAGFAGTWGTETLPLISGVIQSADISEDNLTIDINGVNLWGKYSDMPISGLDGTQGTYLCDDIINLACGAVGIPTEKRYIDRKKSVYNDITVMSSKTGGLNESSGGFGDTWNYNKFDFGDNNVIRSIGQAVHPQSNGFKAIYFKGNYDPSTDYEGNELLDKIYITDDNFNRVTNFVQPNSDTLNDLYQILYNARITQVALEDNIAGNFVRVWAYGNQAVSGASGGTSMFYNLTVSKDSLYHGYSPDLTYSGKWSTGLPVSIDGTVKNTVQRGMFFDSIQGTGYFLNNENGTIKKYQYSLVCDTPIEQGNNIGTFAFTGTTAIQAGAGTNFNVTAAFMLPDPVAVYLGTNKYYYACYGYEGTLNYIYRFGTGTGQNWGFVDKIALGTSFYNIEKIYSYGTDYSGTRGGGYIGTKEEGQGTQWWYISGTILDGTSGTVLNNGFFTYNNGILQTGGHRITNFNQYLGWSPSTEIFNTGNFGFKFQHNTVSTVGSVLVNGSVLSTGSYTVFNDKTGFIYNNLYDKSTLFTTSYNIFGLSLGIGTFSDYTFKDIIQKVTIPMMSYAWFDGNGNLFIKDRAGMSSSFDLTNAQNRTYNNGKLIESYMTANASRDIKKVKNVITCKQSNGTNIAKDLLSIQIYGTRTLPEYTNLLIPTTADAGTMCLIMLEHMKNAKYDVNVSMPFHPELELFDMFNYFDTYNRINASDVLIKSMSHNLMGYTTDLTGVERSTVKIGTSNNQ